MHGGGDRGRRPTTGARSKALRNLGLSSKFNAAVNDPELNSHADNIRTLDVLINARLEGAQPGLPLLEECVLLYDEAMAASTNSVKALRDLGPKLQAALESAQRVEDAVRLMDHQRKHKLAEARREAELELSVSQAEMRALVTALIVAMEEISNPDERRRYYNRVVGIVASRYGEAFIS